MQIGEASLGLRDVPKVAGSFFSCSASATDFTSSIGPAIRPRKTIQGLKSAAGLIKIPHAKATIKHRRTSAPGEV